MAEKSNVCGPEHGTDNKHTQRCLLLPKAVTFEANDAANGTNLSAEGLNGLVTVTGDGRFTRRGGAALI